MTYNNNNSPCFVDPDDNRRLLPFIPEKIEQTDAEFNQSLMEERR
jgi:hypothetical protein